ncbi:CBS domain-containing protein [Virgibacillus dakarensis]|uniref:Thioesterase n=1 Tax=Lentibacillus populi TaxID=1827502 RepID=A0A9W5X415_9BACI|nr:MULTISPECIES: DRTGG domain-containing protein [Bacillaceae]MBT2216575.1 CBS domain-containing protein [Virgibacillus dakarensis]MTW84297.1 CBS domain-containing protein [Virgibacillus dakarensis]GGB27545.1 thioesterase [Lentibacillus populi]
MATKHEQILQHIMSLGIGKKISVRQIAKDLNVSEGTAYRAIKEAESQGLVSTIERVGTIRIERKKKENFERLTFAEVINIVDGQVLGGREGLHKTLNKFLIGAMQLDAMMRYTEADSLLIVGNRVKAHELAIKEGASVLITGGFDTADHIKRLADEKQIPIMSTSYDTFTVAAMINRAIYDQLIKKEIVFVEDISTSLDHSFFLYAKDPLERWYELNEMSTHTRFPVVDEKNRVIGMVTSRDIIGKKRVMLIEKVMTKNPTVVQAKTSLASVAHMMVWEGIELVPVVNQSYELQGIVSRQDVLKALQQIQRQPQIGETIDDIVSSNINTVEGDHTIFQADVTPQMTNQLGTLSNGVFTTLMTEASSRLLLHAKKGDLVVENITVYFLKPVQIDSKLIIKPTLLDVGRIYAKIDVEVYNEQKLVGKGLLMAQLIDR